MQTANYLCQMRILMVCLGNICRSPLAEGVLQQKVALAQLNWLVESAGTNSYHTHEPPHHFSQKVALKNGIDISKQKARTFVKEDFEKYDKIYAMAKDVLEDIKSIGKEKYEPKKVSLLLNEIYPANNADVPDPWYSNNEDEYEKVYALIEKASDCIIKKYK